MTARMGEEGDVCILQNRVFRSIRSYFVTLFPFSEDEGTTTTRRQGMTVAGKRSDGDNDGQGGRSDDHRRIQRRHYSVCDGL